MQISEKIKILADAAKYDASCSSSGSSRKNEPGSIGNGAVSGICHSWAADGRCISLLKVLMSNDCLYECCYCPSRRSNTIERATFSPQELADLTINFYLRNYIEGLFLSSAVYASPDKTMADMVEVCHILRYTHKFNGYIHLKIIPGSSPDLIQKAGFLADRMSVNIELPSGTSLKRLAPQKSKKGIFLPMKQIGENHKGFQRERRISNKAPLFCPGGQTTQMIIGATEENDLQILNLTEKLYEKMALKRVYYSAYMPINEGPLLPAVSTSPPLIREHRLYQADWLLRFYSFQSHEILSPSSPNLDERLDPKAAWALRNFDMFPIDINRASYEELLRIPGVGITSAQRIIKTRRVTAIREQDLKKIGMVLKRARHFITISGKYQGDTSLSHHHIVNAMCRAEPVKAKKLRQNSHQLRLF